MQRSLCASLLFHGAVMGGAALTGFMLQRTATQEEAGPFTLTFIAAPTGFADNPAREPDVTAPTAARPPQVRPVESKPDDPPASVTLTAESALLNKPPSPPVATATAHVEAVPVAEQPSVATAPGDGRSAKPGFDASAVAGSPGSKAGPNYLDNPEPVYPALARRRGQEGLVLLTVKVTAEGRTASVALKESSGYSLLDDAALQAVRHWRFEPARIGLSAVDTEIEVPVRFKLTH